MFSRLQEAKSGVVKQLKALVKEIKGEELTGVSGYTDALLDEIENHYEAGHSTLQASHLPVHLPFLADTDYFQNVRDGADERQRLEIEAEAEQRVHTSLLPVRILCPLTRRCLPARGRARKT